MKRETGDIQERGQITVSLGGAFRWGVRSAGIWGKVLHRGHWLEGGRAGGGMAERVGFEPTDACASPVFKTGSINLSDISPQGETPSLKTNLIYHSLSALSSPKNNFYTFFFPYASPVCPLCCRCRPPVLSHSVSVCPFPCFPVLSSLLRTMPSPFPLPCCAIYLSAPALSAPPIRADASQWGDSRRPSEPRWPGRRDGTPKRAAYPRRASLPPGDWDGWTGGRTFRHRQTIP